MNDVFGLEMSQILLYCEAIQKIVLSDFSPQFKLNVREILFI